MISWYADSWYMEVRSHYQRSKDDYQDKRGEKNVITAQNESNCYYFVLKWEWIICPQVSKKYITAHCCDERSHTGIICRRWYITKSDVIQFEMNPAVICDLNSFHYLWFVRVSKILAVFISHLMYLKFLE